MNKTLWMKNKIYAQVQSWLLVISLATLLGLMGELLGGREGAFFAVGTVVLLYFLNPLISPFLIIRMHRGRKMAYAEAPRLFQSLKVLAGRAGLPRVPSLYYIPGEAANAFTVGSRENAAIAVSDGLLRRLSSRELAAVLAHEISHIRHNDTRIMGFADLASRLTHTLSAFGQLLLFLNLPLVLFGGFAISWLAILLLIFAPTLSLMLQLALSRTREYNADLGAAELMGSPEPLASALVKMERQRAGLFPNVLWPVKPLPPEASLFRTHPPTAERIRRLMEIRGVEADADWNRLSYPGQRRPDPAGAIQYFTGIPRWTFHGHRF